MAMDRRAFIGAGAAACLLGAGRAGEASAIRELRLHVAPGSARLVPEPYPATEVWAYNGMVPGPEIRVRQGQRLRVVVDNGLTEETTVHWHGIRLPNAMDGVPYLTQPPIPPGGTFIYELGTPDAGTFWYHPHSRSLEQVGRGLAGVLIVEEPEPPVVDRDVTWVLDDWRLTAEAAISPDFGQMMDVSHAGRIGNTVTVNGRIVETFGVRAGERLRLRLVNVANARIFALEFQGHAPVIVALDGQPVEPHAPDGGRVVLAPAQRADLILDLAGRPGERHAVIDDNYPRSAYRLLDLAYAPEPPLRERPPPVAALPANPLPEPDLATAQRHIVALTGGMMGGMQSAMVEGRPTDPGEMMRRGLAWAINGVAATGHVHEPMAVLARGHSHVVEIHNHTAWPHPMHLHGHGFRVVSRDGAAVARAEWRDTVLLTPEERVAIAFVADNPGDWMFHCHILEHQAGGMTGVVRVA
jgi:FtsP/CotA-like multicopper oxidase with cupredoxin domain